MGVVGGAGGHIEPDDGMRTEVVACSQRALDYGA